jgi:hypothetical protein
VSIATKLASFERLFTSTLLEAELRATLARAGIADDGSKLLREFYWIRPRRRLTVLIQRVLDQGVQLRGADVWHLACALYTFPRPQLAAFVSLDAKQIEVAGRLGFAP